MLLLRYDYTSLVIYVRWLRLNQVFSSFLGTLVWYTSHLSTMVVNTDPSTQQHAIVVVCIVAPIICTLFVAMRIWTRIFVSHSIIGWDDCELPRLCLHPGLRISLSYTLQMLQSPHWSVLPCASVIPIVALITLFEQPLAIAYSVLIALGAFLAALPLQANLLLTESVGTNYGFGWHTADLWPELLVQYNKVRTFRRLFWPY